MASFKKAQEMLLMCLEEETIDDEEFALLYEEYTPRNPPFTYSSYDNFSFVNKDPAECKADFRVEKGDLPLLVEALRVPPIFKCVNGTLRWNSRIVHSAEEVRISVPIFRYDSDIWTIGARTEPYQQ